MGSNNNVLGKKKAADFYFTKKKESTPVAATNDFMSAPVTPSPQAAPSRPSPIRQSVKMSGGFTYD